MIQNLKMMALIKSTIILSLFVLTGCLGQKYEFKEARIVTIEDGCPPRYTKDNVNAILKYTTDEWIKKYGTPVNYEALSGLTISIQKNAVIWDNRELYGLANVRTMSIQVWAHSENPSDSSIIHEMIHVLYGLSNSSWDADAPHAQEFWENGFESPTKRTSPVQ